MKRYLMKCGHTSNARYGYTDLPACAICGCTEVDHEITDPHEGLEGRKAQCAYCSYTKDSSWLLPFFEYRPERDRDEFYCGCRGWD